jgi:hypothetical protein
MNQAHPTGDESTTANRFAVKKLQAYFQDTAAMERGLPPDVSRSFKMKRAEHAATIQRLMALIRCHEVTRGGLRESVVLASYDELLAIAVKLCLEGLLLSQEYTPNKWLGLMRTIGGILPEGVDVEPSPDVPPVTVSDTLRPPPGTFEAPPEGWGDMGCCMGGDGAY